MSVTMCCRQQTADGSNMVSLVVWTDVGGMLSKTVQDPVNAKINSERAEFCFCLRY